MEMDSRTGGEAMNEGIEKGKTEEGRNSLMGPARRRFSHGVGFTLIELMIAVGVLIIVLVGLLQIFIYCLNLSEFAGNTTLAISEAQGKLEEIRSHKFERIAGDYGLGGSPGNIFELAQLNGEGAIYIDDTNPALLAIEIVVSWQEKGNRIIGEDGNLNGVLDSGEDGNGNGRLDSPVVLVSLIAER